MANLRPKRRFRRCSRLTLLVIALAFIVRGSPAMARPGWGLLLATSAEDPALRARIVALSPKVNPDEARRVASIAYTTGLELARKWDMGSSPTMHVFLINMGIKKGGYCHQFATELLLRLDAQKLKTLDLHWAESDAGTDTEHNVILVTARGQPFEQGIMLDNWRRSGHLLWGTFDGDPDHKWRENRNAMTSRLPRRAATVDHGKKETKPSQTPKTQSKN